MNVDGYMPSMATKYIECPRSDEIVAGRCGSGQISRCPNGSNHGILCCELTVFNNTRIL